MKPKSQQPRQVKNRVGYRIKDFKYGTATNNLTSSIPEKIEKLIDDFNSLPVSASVNILAGKINEIIEALNNPIIDHVRVDQPQSPQDTQSQKKQQWWCDRCWLWCDTEDCDHISCQPSPAAEGGTLTLGKLEELYADASKHHNCRCEICGDEFVILSPLESGQAGEWEKEFKRLFMYDRGGYLEFDIHKAGNVGILIDFINSTIKLELSRQKKELIHAINPFDLVESCNPDCTPVEHAYHQGTWDAHLKLQKILDHLSEQPVEQKGKG